MKSTVWFELPKALIELGKDILSSKDVEYMLLLTESSKNLTMILEEISADFIRCSSKSKELSMPIDQLKLLKDKLNELNKERVDLICKCIKSSIQIISKLMDHFELKRQFNIDSINKDTLNQIKIFSQIIRVIITNAESYEQKAKLQKEKSFFNMILAYIEKTQTKLYHVSTDLINSYLSQQGKQAMILDLPMKISNGEPVNTISGVH